MPCPCWKFIIFYNITLVSVHYFNAKEFSLGAGRDEVGVGCARFAKKSSLISKIKQNWLRFAAVLGSIPASYDSVESEGGR
jgi:hypothetical protein